MEITVYERGNVEIIAYANGNKIEIIEREDGEIENVVILIDTELIELAEKIKGRK